MSERSWREETGDAMTMAHSIHFPRYRADIMEERRTLFHVPVDENLANFEIGDKLKLLEHPNLPRCKVGIVTDARQVALLDHLDTDLDKLGSVDRGGYLASWDQLHHEMPSCLNPMVWRIEFRYGRASDLPDPPEWALAA